MSSTVQVKISDAEIARQAAISGVRELRDPRHPTLRFRFLTDRARGSWYVVQAGKWQRVARFPDIGAGTMLGALPQVMARLLADPAAKVAAGVAVRLGEVLRWYSARVETDRNLSLKRRRTVVSVIRCHLLPRLEDVLVESVERNLVDERLVWPMQHEFSVGYIRQTLRVLFQALQQAVRLNRIEANPLAGVKFVDFIRTKIMPKPARLHGIDVEGLLKTLATQFAKTPEEGMLALMMLCHGTRLGETRQARWRHISLIDRVWILPSNNTKTGTELILPLTSQVCALLDRYRVAQRPAHRDSGFLFPGAHAQPLSEKQASEVFRRLGEGEWTSHDLRKVARTMWAELGVDYLIGEMLLNHAMGFSAQTYIRTSADELKREALEKWHAWLDGRGFASIHGAAEVGSAFCADSPEATDDEAGSVSQSLQMKRMGSAEKGEEIRS